MSHSQVNSFIQLFELMSGALRDSQGRYQLS